MLCSHKIHNQWMKKKMKRNHPTAKEIKSKRTKKAYVVWSKIHKKG